MSFVPTPTLKLSDDYCREWKLCLPDDFQKALSQERSSLSDEVREKLENVSDPEDVVNIITEDDTSGMSDIQAFLLLCWMAKTGGWHKVERLMDNEKMQETLNAVVKQAIGPRMAKAIVIRNIQDIRPAPIPGPKITTPSMGN